MQEEEVWKDIVIEKNGIVYDFTGLYQVSNLGRVRSLDRTITKLNNGTLCETFYEGRILVLSNTEKRTHLQITLHKDNFQITFQIHRLVATMFIPNPNNLPFVNHKDENGKNNIYTNLEWCTPEYNCNYGTRNQRCSEKLKGRTFTNEWKQKLKDNHADTSGAKNPKAKKVICLETQQIFGCIKDAKQWLGKGDIGACLKGRTETAGGYHWQYVD